MKDYKRPNKNARDEAWMRSVGLIEEQPYQEEEVEQIKTFLLVCEGKNTEPDYFESFPVPAEVVRAVGGAGIKTSLVKTAIKEASKQQNEGREVWCVFDFDILPANTTQKEDFNRAIQMALDNDFHVAYTNDAFELWFVLHYQECETALHRDGYFDILRDRWQLEHNYRKMGKTKGFSEGIYDRLENDKDARQDLAIRRAERLCAIHEGKPYADRCPCTTVHVLVAELNKYAK